VSYRRLRRPVRLATLVGCLALALAPAPPLAASGGLLAAAGPETQLLLDPPVVTPILPEHPEAALAEAVSALGGALGVPLQPAWRIAAAGLPRAITGRLALLTAGLLDCYQAAAPARALLGAPWVAGALTLPADHPPADALPVLARVSKVLRECAGRLQSLALETSRFLAASPAAGGEGLDLWPVLRYSAGSAADRYLHDYALLVDEGGDDRYLNNAGGSLLDVRRSPTNSSVARGCHKVAKEAPPGNLTFEECIFGVALVIDVAGNDTYGAREAPDPTDDGFCTADPLVRRIELEGAGLAGVGMLIDRAGNDHYVGKTGSQGSGHLAGVGILRDEGGDDSYLAIRNAQGYALLGGFGLLRDEGGNDVFDRYMPGPLDPEALYQRPGAGGVTDDRGTCDNLARQLQGSGFLGGALGMLVNVSGNDTYRGAPPAVQDFGNDNKFPHGSQGYGNFGGFGVLSDEGGRDVYQEVPGRGDGKTINPSPDSAGIFEDDGP
jgi:hypothetical protein